MQLKLAEEIIQWTVLDDGVTVDQQSKDGFTWQRCTIIWPSGLDVAEFLTVLDCWNVMFPFQFFFGDEGLDWTDRVYLTTYIFFSEYEFIQCMGILLRSSLAGQSNIRDLWNIKSSGFCQPLDLLRRFGLSRDRFLYWKKYLKLWPPAVNEHTWDAVRGLISAFKTTRMQNVKPGTKTVVDEKWIPMFEGTPENIPHLTIIIWKPCEVDIKYKDVAELYTETVTLPLFKLQEHCLCMVPISQV